MGISSTKPFYTTKEVADFVGVTAPTVIKWVEQGRIRAMRTAGGHRRISREELMRFAKECGVEWSPDSPFSVSDNILRIVVFDLELDFAEMVAEFLNLQEGLSAKSVDSLVDVGFALGWVRPDVLLCTDEVGMISLGRILRCAEEFRTRVIITSNGPVRHFDSPGIGGESPDVIEKPLKLDALLKTILAP